MRGPVAPTISSPEFINSVAFFTHSTFIGSPARWLSPVSITVRKFMPVFTMRLGLPLLPFTFKFPGMAARPALSSYFAVLGKMQLGIEFIVRMAFWAVSFFGIKSRWANTTKYIFFFRYWLKMHWITASPIAAQMIQYFIFWNIPKFIYPHDAMRGCYFSVYHNLTVTFGAFAACPYPAFIWSYLNVLQNTFYGAF